jgi:hypothetical protein
MGIGDSVIDPISLLRSARDADQHADDLLKEHGSEGPACPHCGYTKSRVLQSRLPLKRDDYKRRRECLSCRQRFTTYEKIAS